MPTFSLPKTFYSRAIKPSSCITVLPKKCRLSIIIATCRPGKSPRTAVSSTSRKSGSPAITTSGGPCEPPACAERFITGDASDREKFQKWAETVPQTLRNPLYHWTHLELKRPFGISDRLLNPQTAEGIWNQCNAKLARPEFSCRGIMRQMNVVVSCTTDDPTDSLEYHAALAADASFPVKVLPAFRPDKATAVENPPGLQCLGGEIGRGKRHGHQRRFRPLHGSLAQPPRFFPLAWAAGSRITASKPSTPRITRPPTSTPFSAASAAAAIFPKTTC